MPMRKIADAPNVKRCLHPDHDPPNAIALEPGTYEHTCSRCGHKTTFTVKGFFADTRELTPSLSSARFDLGWPSLA